VFACSWQAAARGARRRGGAEAETRSAMLCDTCWIFMVSVKDGRSSSF
jgi:hypothetical protein